MCNKRRAGGRIRVHGVRVVKEACRVAERQVRIIPANGVARLTKNCRRAGVIVVGVAGDAQLAGAERCDPHVIEIVLAVEEHMRVAAAEVGRQFGLVGRVRAGLRVAGSAELIAGEPDDQAIGSHLSRSRPIGRAAADVKSVIGDAQRGQRGCI